VELTPSRRAATVHGARGGTTAALATHRWGGVTRSSSHCLLEHPSWRLARLGGAATRGGCRGVGRQHGGGRMGKPGRSRGRCSGATNGQLSGEVAQ
jgi:hypothetical protein